VFPIDARSLEIEVEKMRAIEQRVRDLEEAEIMGVDDVFDGAPYKPTQDEIRIYGPAIVTLIVDIMKVYDDRAHVQNPNEAMIERIKVLTSRVRMAHRLKRNCKAYCKPEMWYWVFPRLLREGFVVNRIHGMCMNFRQMCFIMTQYITAPSSL
jgi:hypothetical protein